MDISFSYFLEAMLSNPVLAITIILTLGVIFVNGLRPMRPMPSPPV